MFPCPVRQRIPPEERFYAVARIGSLAAALFLLCFLAVQYSSVQLNPPFSSIPSLPPPSFPSYSFLSTSIHPSPLVQHHLTANSPPLPFSPPLLPSLPLSPSVSCPFFLVTLTLSQTDKLFLLLHCIFFCEALLLAFSLFLLLSLNHFTTLHHCIFYYPLFLSSFFQLPLPSLALKPQYLPILIYIVSGLFVSLLGNCEHTYYPDPPPLSFQGFVETRHQVFNAPSLGTAESSSCGCNKQKGSSRLGNPVLGFPFFLSFFPFPILFFFSIYSKHRHDPDVITKIPLRRVCLFNIIHI